jgi:PAS domain S-box-containing protein
VAVIATEVSPQAQLNKKIKESEGQFRRLVMQAPVAICVLRGEDYLIETINEQMIEMWDRTMEEAMNKPVFDVLIEFRDQGLKELLDQVYKTGENIVINELPLSIKRKGALTDIFVKFIYEPLREADGTISGVMALAHEITDQVIARKRMEALLDTMPQIAWTNTTEGEITFYNQRWYDYTGLDHKQTNSLGCKTVINPEDLQVALDSYRSIRETSDGGEFQVRGKGVDGSYRWHLIRLMPIRNDDGDIQLWIGTATDIQELKLLQQQKDDFISIASHELKTPITSLKASLQLLDRIKDNPANIMLPKLIVQANKSLNKVSVLMDDLLNASIANEGQLHINKKLINLSKVIEECCPHVRTEGIYTIKTEGDMDVEVYADAARIDQVVINFVNNAIKYAAGSKEIQIFIEKVNDTAKVSIIDKGPGIPPDKLLHLFERFYRVDSSGSQYSGLGLGLYISAEIIKKHNGQIGVISELGKGSTFWFSLPVA